LLNPQSDGSVTSKYFVDVEFYCPWYW